jgi:large subunit ribosomal protein L13
MDMNKTFFLRKEDRKPKWHVIDATDQVLGRLATRISDVLRGKDKAEYTPHADCGDYVIITNSDKIRLTGKKWTDKMYSRYSGWRSGLKHRSAAEAQEKDHTFLIRHAVKGMLPKNRLSRQVIKHLKIYQGTEHPHQAQI